MKAWDIMMTCNTGTIRLIDDGHGARWERERHTITYCREYTEQDRDDTLSRLGARNPTVHRVWAEATAACHA